MKKKTKAIFSWSGGKDSTYCLHKVLQQNEFEIVALLTTVNSHFKRISMHGVREELLDMQAESIGIPLCKMYVGEKSTNEEYETEMRKILENYRKQGVKHVIFGDIFLEDLRLWREKNLAKIGMKGVFPLWKFNTLQMVNDFIKLGYVSITCCINDGYLNENMVGRKIDQTFLNELPQNTDPCGENGEFHSFAIEGPVFSKPIKIALGEKVYKPLEVKIKDDIHHGNINTKGFWYCDILPV